MAPDSSDRNREVYRRLARYYDAYVSDFVQDLPIYLDSVSQDTVNRVLEIGCGTGRVLQALLNAGSLVTGVDISEDMLEIARHKLRAFLDRGQLSLQNHNFTDSPLPEQFERVFVTFYTFNYLLTTSEAKRFLQNLNHSMSERAVLIMDLFFPAALANPRTAGEWNKRSLGRGENTVWLSDRRTMDGRVEKREQVFEENSLRSEIVTYRRFYSRAEIIAMLKEAGFHKIMVANAYDKKAFQEMDASEEPKTGFMIKACQ